MRIPLFYCGNENIYYLLLTSIQSLLNNKDNNSLYNIYIIMEKKFSDNKIEVLNRYQSNSIKINYIELDEKYSKLLTAVNEERITKGGYIRIFIPFIIKDLKLKYNKVIYMDCDTLIMSDLRSLYDLDVEEYSCLMYQEYNRNHMDEGFKDTILRKDLAVFNSGVILFNVDKYLLKSNDLFKALFNKDVQKKHDESLLNFVLNETIGFLPLRYNCINIFDLFDKKGAAQNIVNCYRMQNTIIKHNFNDIYNELKNICIIHYVSKPWVPFSNCGFTWFNVLMDACKDQDELREFLKWVVDFKSLEFVKIDNKPHPLLNPCLQKIM